MRRIELPGPIGGYASWDPELTWRITNMRVIRADTSEAGTMRRIESALRDLEALGPCPLNA